MQEIIPGVHRWLREHPNIHKPVSSAEGHLLELEPQHLLLAHGPPVVGSGGEALAEFVASAG